MSTLDVFNHNIPVESSFGYSQAIKSDDLVHVSGQLSFSEDGEFLHAGDTIAQLKQTYAWMDKVLAHYGATRNQIVSQTLYVVNLRENFEATAQANVNYFGDHRPVSTILGVPDLGFPDQVIEIAFIIDMKLPA
ncbi:RidA family protein [Streptomyces sp. NPDC048231]|uniref:RidA family protein n=1 Tax=Streptomyces sp. NPDC048231 TaxID=3365519 RepID=UPI003722F6C3